MDHLDSRPIEYTDPVSRSLRFRAGRKKSKSLLEVSCRLLAPGNCQAHSRNGEPPDPFRCVRRSELLEDLFPSLAMSW
jgi:hypothetical protein